MKTFNKILIPLVLILFTFFLIGCPNPNTDTDTEPDVTIPAAPTALIATVESDTAVSLAWTDNADNETGFVIEWSKTNDFATIEDTATPTADVTTLVATGLDASNEYFFRIKAVNSAGDSTYAEASATTDDPPVTIPAAPTNLIATVESDTTISLAWTDNSSDETGFVLEWDTDSTFGSADDETPGANATTASITGLIADTEYFFRVKAVNSAGNSAWSATESATTNPVPAAGTFYINANATYATSTSVTLNSNISNVVEMRFQNAGGVWSGWETYSATKAWTLTTGDGTKTVNAEFKNSVGSILNKTDTIILDTILPNASFQINAGAGYTTSTSVTLNIGIIADVNEMRFQNTGGTWSAWYSANATMAWTLSSGDGTKTVNAEFKDVAGNVRTRLDTIILDKTAPIITSFLVNSGATYTNSTSVTLNNNVSGATQMRFMNSSDAWSSWYTYATSISWTLPTGDGTKIVNAEFRDVAGNVSLPKSDSITLDTKKPIITSFLINGGATYANTTTVTLNNNVSGATQMRFVNAGGSWSTWYTYSSTKTWTLASGDGTRTVYAGYKDAAGNTTITVSDSIIVDTTPPNVTSFKINNDAADSMTKSVTLNISASDVYQMRFRNETTSTWSAWQSYTTSKAWTLPAGENYTRTVYAQFKDSLGNIRAVNDSIMLDEIRRVKITPVQIWVTQDGDSDGPGEIYWYFYYRNYADPSGTVANYIDNRPYTNYLTLNTSDLYNFPAGTETIISLKRTSSYYYSLSFQIYDYDTPSSSNSASTYATFYGDTWGISTTLLNLYATNSEMGGMMRYRIEKVD